MELWLISPWPKRKERKTLAPSLTLPTLAALTPKEILIRIFDEKVQDIPSDGKPDLVGITVMTHTAKRAYELADAFRKRESQVVLGGIHATALPKEAKKHADSIVIGEAEDVWTRVIQDAKKHALRHFYESATPDLNGLPAPHWDLIDKSKYWTWQLVQTTRGCPFNCEFCSVTKFFGRKLRSRPIEEVVREIEELEGKWLFFMDDNIVGNPLYAKLLFEQIKGLKKRWAAQASIQIAENIPLLKQAAQSGCKLLFIGFESLHERNLLKFKRFQSQRIEKFKDAINEIHEQGIAIFGSFILGQDGDDGGIFEKTLAFAEENKIEAAFFTAPTPLPGTGLRNRLKKENRIIDFDWDHYDFVRVVIKPQNMTAEELQEGIHRLWKEFYSGRSTFKRLFVGGLGNLIFEGIALNWYLHGYAARLQR
ncbi:MAG: B12-binding domain-containing radical SAM protein [Candidatus Poribacteria bacterium]